MCPGSKILLSKYFIKSSTYLDRPGRRAWHSFGSQGLPSLPGCVASLGPWRGQNHTFCWAGPLCPPGGGPQFCCSCSFFSCSRRSCSPFRCSCPRLSSSCFSSWSRPSCCCRSISRLSWPRCNPCCVQHEWAFKKKRKVWIMNSWIAVFGSGRETKFLEVNLKI